MLLVHWVHAVPGTLKVEKPISEIRPGRDGCNSHHLRGVDCWCRRLAHKRGNGISSRLHARDSGELHFEL